MHLIYKITNLINNKIYIGQTIDPKDRWKHHKNEARKKQPLMIINQAMKKYGIENFTFQVIASCLDQDSANDIETLLVIQEQSHISFGKGYNVSSGGSNAPKTEEFKQLISVKAKERFASDPKYRELSSATNKGRKHSEESKNNMSAAHKGYKPSEETRKKLSEAKKGNKNSLGSKQSAETIAKRVEKLKGRPRSEETKKKISDAQKGKILPHHLKPNDGWFKKKDNKIA